MMISENQVEIQSVKNQITQLKISLGVLNANVNSNPVNGLA
jgi:hypothetical protein